MNAGRALWEARWFRVVTVFAVVATVSALLVPPVVRQATEREAARGLLVWMEHPDLTPVITRVGAAPATEPYWVQVGVFRDADAAKRVAQRLRERKYRVQESLVQRHGSAGGAAETATGPEQGNRARYEVVVSGGASSELAAKVAAKGLAGHPSTEGVIITPSLPLSEAVALSRDLADDGLAVRVRRIGSPAASVVQGAERHAPSARGRDTLHRVRVGSFADRAAAVAVVRELEALGYKPFLARGSE